MLKKETSFKKIYRFLVYAMPAILYFSFRPWINLGSNDTMNFDLSLPLIWLVLFDILAFILVVKKKQIKQIFNKWMWLLLPVFLTLSILWSHDKLRSVMIIGVLWLLYFAVFSFSILQDEISDEKFKRVFLKIFFGVGIFVCIWCFMQCIMDVMGVSQGNTLLCEGCVYRIFGFPHPNGFAAEPQFMGNLLLAPIFVSLYLLVKQKYFSRRSLVIMLFVFTATLFLTLSRWAIYAFVVAMIFFTIMWGIKRAWRVLWVWLVIGLAFLFTLNMQGIFSEVSKTDDTYIAGVSKAINQLTLGIVDLGGSQIKKDGIEENIEGMDVGAIENVETEDLENEKAVFDGYVEVSTDNRLDAWNGALKTWTKDPATVIFGVGLGSGLISMYENGAIASSREIINNQYVSLLLESGIIGIGLLILSLSLVFITIRKNSACLLIMTLVIAYGVSLCFFSGLPNALHIYLLPAILMVIFRGGKSSYRKQ